MAETGRGFKPSGDSISGEKVNGNKEIAICRHDQETSMQWSNTDVMEKRRCIDAPMGQWVMCLVTERGFMVINETKAKSKGT